MHSVVQLTRHPPFPFRGKRIHVPHALDAAGPQDVVDADDVFMAEPQQDLDLPQCALTVRLMLKWTDLLNGHARICHAVIGRAAWGGGGKRGLQLQPAQ